jgi:propionyl-CoA synthetase
MNRNTAGLHDRIHARSLSDPEGFWGAAAEGISWIKPWDRVLDDYSLREGVQSC